MRIAKDLRLLQADSKDSDLTGRMPRLMRVFAGRTYHFVGFVMLRLINFSRKTGMLVKTGGVLAAESRVNEFPAVATRLHICAYFKNLF